MCKYANVASRRLLRAALDGPHGGFCVLRLMDIVGKVGSLLDIEKARMELSMRALLYRSLVICQKLLGTFILKN